MKDMGRGAVPKLRFPGFDTGWEPVCLRDHLLQHQERVPSHTDIPVYSSSRSGLKSQKDYFSGDELRNEGEYGVVPNGFFTYRHMSDDLTFKFNINRLGHPIAVSKEYPVFTTSNLDSDFLLKWLNNSHHFSRFAAQRKMGGTRTRLYFNNLKELKALFPNLPEQRKIATFLSAVDTKIAHLSRKKALLEDYKKGCMQQIFSRKMRFEDEEGRAFPEWEEKRLGSFGDLYGGLSGKSGEDFGEGSSFITYRQVFESARINASKFALVKIGPKEKQNRVVFGDVLMTTSSETPSEVGFASVMLDEVEELYLNSFCFGYRPYDLKALLPEFSKYLFRSPLYRREVIKLAQGSTRFNISRTGFLKIKLLFPHPEEQEKIAAFLSALDTKIDLVGKELTQARSFKQGLLQQMFV